jgi:RNA polymerase sigma-70 factor (ECF subfamily)
LALPERSSLLLAQGLLAGSASTPSEQVARGELAERVRQAVRQLSDTDREIVLLRNFEGLSNQEIASLLGLKPEAASRRYGRALMRLRELLLIAGLGEDHA